MMQPFTLRGSMQIIKKVVRVVSCPQLFPPDMPVASQGHISKDSNKLRYHHDEVDEHLHGLRQLIGKAGAGSLQVNAPFASSLPWQHMCVGHPFWCTIASCLSQTALCGQSNIQQRPISTFQLLVDTCQYVCCILVLLSQL